MENFASNLIEAVCAEQIIYNKRSVNYYNRLERNKAWERISKKVDKSEEECEKKWISLRERYGRELRKRNQASGSAQDLAPEWEYLETMTFLKDFVKPRKTKNNELCETESPLPLSSVLNAPIEDSPSQESTEPPTPTSRKRKMCEAQAEIAEEFKKTLSCYRSAMEKKGNQDETDELFLKTILSLMKDIPRAEKDSLRKEIFNLVIDVTSKCTNNM